MENCFHQRDRERKRIVGQIYRRNAQVSIAVILVVSPSPQKIAPQIRLSFHTRISTPICHACIEATYLYTSLRIVIMETNALHQNQNYHSIGMIDFSKGQLVSTRRLVIENTLSLSLSWAMTKVNLHFSFSSNRIPFSTSSQSSSFIPLIDDICFDEILINALQFLKIYLHSLFEDILPRIACDVHFESNLCTKNLSRIYTTYIDR